MIMVGKVFIPTTPVIVPTSNVPAWMWLTVLVSYSIAILWVVYLIWKDRND